MTEIMKEVNKLVENLKTHPQITAVILFGSYAKGKIKPLSDVDIAVILKDRSMEAEIASFSSRVLDVVPFHRLPLYIQFEVFKYGKVLFVKDREHFLELKKRVLRDYLEMSGTYERISRRILA